ncbi:MAG: EamA family transporter [Rhizobiaceae bacterium]|nr:EamA family transporter [Rhizobiaceae bacterium]
MSTNRLDILITATAPIVWGSTYLVTTEFLAGFSPMNVALLRALPAGLLLLAIVRVLPTGRWWLRAFVLGVLNISVFLSLLFVAAYRLPGGVAGTVLSAQPLIVVFLAAVMFSEKLQPRAVLGALAGMGGVALLVLTPNAALDPIGVAAGLAGAASMALGTTLTRRWSPPVSPLVFTAWQLTAGGLLLVPVCFFIGGPIQVPDAMNLLGLFWLSLVGGALTYAIWFRGIGKLAPQAVSSLLFLSPLTAVLLGWVVLGQSLNMLQIMGIVVVMASIWLCQRSGK